MMHTVKITLQHAVKSVIAGLKLVHFSDQIQTDNNRNDWPRLGIFT